jgi:hypothetical protein
MSTTSPNENTYGFDYFSSNLGFKVTVIIEPPTDERLQNSLNFLDPEQMMPLAPFLEQEALRFAGGNLAKSQTLLRFALNWDSEPMLSHQERLDGMRVLDAAYDTRMKAYRAWQQKNLIPEARKIVAGIQEAISTGLANFERVKCEELAEKINYSLRTELRTPQGTYTTKKVRGRKVAVFRATPGRTKGIKNAERKVTYADIIRTIKSYENNEFGNIPSEKEIAWKLGCDPKTIKNCLLEKGEKRRFSVFVRTVFKQR